MSRIALYYLLPLILPALVYFAYRLWAQRTGRATEDIPWVWLAAAGVALAAMFAGAMTVLGGGAPANEPYQEPTWQEEGGGIDPGGFGPGEKRPIDRPHDPGSPPE